MHLSQCAAHSAREITKIDLFLFFKVLITSYNKIIYIVAASKSDGGHFTFDFEDEWDCFNFNMAC